MEAQMEPTKANAAAVAGGVGGAVDQPRFAADGPPAPAREEHAVPGSATDRGTQTYQQSFRFKFSAI